MNVYVIAEIGSTHDGSFGNAKCLIEAAAECGVNAVKFQTHIAAAETIRNAPMPAFFKGEPRYSYFERTGFLEAQWHELKEHAIHHGVDFLSSPFSIEAVDLLERVGVHQYKIPSGEVTNLPMLRHIAATGKPIILSSGMSNWTELDAAVEVIRSYHNNFTILQCTSAYPCAYEKVGLNVIAELRERYNCPVGLSDHTDTIYASVAAATLGATMIEKHFTLSRRAYGSDAKHSLEPHEMTQMVAGIRAVEKMLSTRVDKNDLQDVLTMKHVFEKSLVSVVDIPLGSMITRDMIAVKKPGGGIAPTDLEFVIGQVTTRFIAADQTIQYTDIERFTSVGKVVNE
jgi:N-acetylneuraminate synthase